MVLPPNYSQYHHRVHSQGQQLQHLQAELNKLHKEVSSVRAAHSEVRPLHRGWGPAGRLRGLAVFTWKAASELPHPESHGGESFTRPLSSYLRALSY